jgi:hypothetical protein
VGEGGRAPRGLTGVENGPRRAKSGGGGGAGSSGARGRGESGPEMAQPSRGGFLLFIFIFSFLFP